MKASPRFVQICHRDNRTSMYHVLDISHGYFMLQLPCLAAVHHGNSHVIRQIAFFLEHIPILPRELRSANGTFGVGSIESSMTYGMLALFWVAGDGKLAGVEREMS